MVPVYPFIVLSAAVLLAELWDKTAASASSPAVPASPAAAAEKKRARPSILRIVCSATLTLSMILGVSRSVALWRYYGEPDRAAAWLYRHIEASSSSSAKPSRVNVCVGKEWFRYPPAYFLPSNARLIFVESASFTGALPLDFVETMGLNGTCTTAGPMNDLNRAESGQSLPRDLVRARCDYIFDTTLGDGGEEMRRAAESDDGSGPRGMAKKPLRGGGTEGRERLGYKIIHTGEMLDASRTPAWARVLYVPMWSEKVAQWASVIVAEIVQ